ncbi:Jerky-like, partial [Aphis craccivora]
ADVAAFRPIKAGWKKGVFDWRNEHPGSAVTKNDFSPILDKVLKNTVRAEVLINGFRACGLFPWNVNNIDFKNCLGKNPNTEITAVVNKEIDTSMLDYKQFSDIVGTETIDKFKDIKNVITNESLPEEFFVLYRLHEKLKNNQGTIHQVSNDAEQLFSDNSMPPSNEIIRTTSDQIQPQEKSKNDTTPINSLELVEITENLVEVKKLSISPIESVLVRPLTPEHKGTRITERVPFVISSQKWQTLYEEKEKKEQPKRRRTIEKRRDLKTYKQKNQKCLKTPLKTQQLTIIESSDKEDGTVDEIKESSLRQDILYKTTGLCFACANNCNEIDNGLECMFCNKLYHTKCLDPKEYCCLGSDDILYICFKCQKNFNK